MLIDIQLLVFFCILKSSFCDSILSLNDSEINNSVPMRFYVYFDNSDYDIKFLKKLFLTVTERISQLLHIIQPVKEKLLLPRICQRVWVSGKNINRCASIGPNYKGEYCFKKRYNFLIPESHLKGLHIFNESSVEPILSLPSGDGVFDADYIIYVKVALTSLCQIKEKIVHAYGDHCRRDAKGRPIAGIINLCPVFAINKEKLFNIIIHEMFHILGFSKDLFCSQQKYGSQKNCVVKDDYGIYRLILPTVVQKMRVHFNCSLENYGAPLKSSIHGNFQSHWDDYFMYGSIMSSHILNPKYTSIDVITLAVFADSGWYHVNFSAASPYFWGKGGGCYFGYQKSCSQQKGFCDLKNESMSLGCDFLHYTSSTCKKFQEHDTCGIYEPNEMDNCWKYPNSACALVQYSNHSSNTSRCFSYKCNLQSEIELYINDQWTPCIKSFIEINNYLVFCPPHDILCYRYQNSSLLFSTLNDSTVSKSFFIHLKLCIFYKCCIYCTLLFLYIFVINKIL